MLLTLAFLVALVILGDTFAAASGWSVPGPAVGLAVLTAAFAWNGKPYASFERLFDMAAPWFPLFFVPAAAGVLAHLALLWTAWLHIAVAVVIGTALALVITGQLAQALLALAARRKSNV